MISCKFEKLRFIEQCPGLGWSTSATEGYLEIRLDVGERDPERFPVQVELQGAPPAVEVNPDDGAFAPLEVGVRLLFFAAVVNVAEIREPEEDEEPQSWNLLKAKNTGLAGSWVRLKG